MLFPDADEKPLVGIAALRERSPILDAKQRVRYFELETRNVIGRVSGTRMPFDWTINPYRGCEFGCRYCYARYTHEFMELRDPAQFEEQIYAKRFSEFSLQQELRKIPLYRAIAIGTATDPYQPAERKYGLTRRILTCLVQESGRTVSLITKSDLITRDADLLMEIGRKNRLQVFLTVTTLDARLARVLEPYAPRPDLRMQALSILSGKGISTALSMCPLMPLINDSEANMRALVMAAKTAGAVRVIGNPLFLKPCAQAAFFPMLEREFPHLVRRYRERYEHSAYLKGTYPERIRERLRRIRLEAGLPSPDVPEDSAGALDQQLTLFTLTSSPNSEELRRRSRPGQYSRGE